MSNERTSYQPGACNIGSRERRRRYTLAAAALAVAVAMVAGAVLDAFPRPLLPALFVPLALGVEWYLQASRSFCAILGALGRYSFSDADNAGRVRDPTARRADRSSALRMTATAVVVAALVTLAVSVVV